MSTLFLLSSSLGHKAYAAPLTSNLTSDINVSVVSGEHSTRLIWNIVWSCLSTTIACTWVSIHPNMSFHREENWGVRNRRFLLTMLSLFAPELMVMWACKQWRGSQNIKGVINKYVKDHMPNDPKKKEWSQVHAHFLQMGGFKVVFLEKEKEVFKNEMEYRRDDGQWECVVRFETFEKLLKEGHIDLPDLTEDEIKDRSKFDNISKVLVLLQLSWFIAQILARAFQHLAITQLEITTAALATMNFVMYYFWWHKPLNAQYPEIIYSIGIHKLMNKRDHKKLKSRHAKRRSNVGCVDDKAAGVTNNPKNPEIKGRKVTSLGDHDRHGFLWHISRRLGNCSRPMGDYACRLWCTLDLAIRPNVHVRWLAPILVAIPSVAVATAHAALLIITGSLIVALPWNEIHRSTKDVSTRLTETSKLYNWAIRLTVLLRMPESIHYSKKVNESLFYSEHAEWTSRLFQIVAVLAGIVFGAIHCLAWNFDFPSHTEENVWRISSVVMISVNIYLAVGVSALIKLRDCVVISPTFIAEEDALIFISIIFSSIIHAIARIVLIVLAIISLRDLPPSALEAIGWSDLIPHF